jgi:type III pantothenate kinase
MQAGIVLGYSGLVESIIKRTEDELGEKITVVATGGLSTVMAPLIPAIQHIEPLLTLNGLKLVRGFAG